MEVLIYVAKVNLYWLLFYSFYSLMLSSHTFFKLNRLYLVGSLFVSLALPFIEFSEKVKVAPTVYKLTESYHGSPAIPPQHQFFWPQLLIIMYAAATAYMLFKLIRGFYNLQRIVSQGESMKLDDFTLIILPKSLPAKTATGSFSFFNLLVVSHDDYEFHFDTILQHERIHIKQLHSLDILFIELLKVLFWFNPVLWCYKFSIRKVHEFLADQQAENRDNYAEFLVSYAQNASSALITSHFFHSLLLKERIQMIYKNRTSNWLLYRYLIIIPVIITTVFITATRKRLIEVSSNGSPVRIVQTAAGNENKEPAKMEARPEKKSFKSKFKTRVKPQLPDNEEIAIQDTVKTKKRYFTNYRIVPVKVQTVKPFFPTLNAADNAMEKSSVDLTQTDAPKTSAIGLSGYHMAPQNFYPTPIKVKYFSPKQP